jgi:hypothetical protein
VAELVHQLPALIGVIIGALASYLAGAGTERARWKHERLSRWDQKRAQVYSDYGYAIKNVYVQCRRIADNYRGLGVQRDTINIDDALEHLGRLTEARTVVWESVRLLGDPKTVQAGHDWHELIWQMELFARGERTDAGEWSTLLVQVNGCRDRFYAAARSDLGIGGDLPPTLLWDDPPVLGSGTAAPEVT